MEGQIEALSSVIRNIYEEFGFVPPEQYINDMALDIVQTPSVFNNINYGIIKNRIMRPLTIKMRPRTIDEWRERIRVFLVPYPMLRYELGLQLGRITDDNIANVLRVTPLFLSKLKSGLKNIYTANGDLTNENVEGVAPVNISAFENTGNSITPESEEAAWAIFGPPGKLPGDVSGGRRRTRSNQSRKRRSSKSGRKRPAQNQMKY